MKKFPCDGKPRVCPGECNPRNQIKPSACQRDKQIAILPYHQENVVNRNVYYKHEFSLFSRRTQTDQGNCQRPDSSGLSPEEREFIEGLSRRIDSRRRERGFCSRGRLVRRFLAFLLFFFIHGCIAALARNYQQYQTFLATQLCGFITIMFWD